MRLLLVSLVVIAGTRSAAADRITMRVVDVAGGVAYLDAGRAAGVVRGTKIRIGRATLTVTETTEKTSVAELGGVVVAIGATGSADVTGGVASDVRRLPAPRPVEAFREQWPETAVPAVAQNPTLVPLGSGRPPGRAHVTVIGHAFVTADRNRIGGQGEGRVIASFDVLADAPLAVDLDVAGRAFRSGADGQARIPGFVRTAQLRYGTTYDPRFALGRLRYAASSVGMLDGARASARVGSLQIGAFGGVVPDPVNGKPDTSATRFGTELVYDNDTGPWRPRLALTTYGSTWEGELDEKRVTITGGAHRDAWYVDGWAEAQAFASDNPWGARAVELTGAGTTVQWRKHRLHVGSDVTFLRPERSLRLAAALPPEWLCTQRPEQGDVPSEGCTGGDSWVSGSAFAGIRERRWSIDATGALGRTNGVAVAYDATGYLAGELRFGPQRLLAGVSGGRTSFARWIGGHLGAGVALGRRVDATLRYRPEVLDYVAATGRMLLHSAVVDVHVALDSTLDLALSGVATTGVDRDAAALLTTLAWRPLP